MTPHPTRSGYLYGLAALTLWGILPLYWKQLAAVPSLEVIGHRAAWSVVFLLLFCAARGANSELIRVLTAPKKLATLAVTGALIASNWLVYVWGVTHGMLLESSLGYFLCPLVTIAPLPYQEICGCISEHGSVAQDSQRQYRTLARALSCILNVILRIRTKKVGSGLPCRFNRGDATPCAGSTYVSHIPIKSGRISFSQ
jgi:hypothetical protein